jgi:hypothetical protein
MKWLFQAAHRAGTRTCFYHGTSISSEAGNLPASRGQQGTVSTTARRFCSAGQERPSPRQIKPLRFDQPGRPSGQRLASGFRSDWRSLLSRIVFSFTCDS